MKQGEDYYFNKDGLMVLTTSYLSRRGYCCGNACRHCPYLYVNVPEPAKSKLILAREKEIDKKKN